MATIEIKVPDIGDYSDVPVIEVLVAVGDTVKKDQGLVTLESDKATLEVPSSAAGVVKEIKVKLGEYVIGTIDEAFLERLKKNDVFVLGGESYVFNFARGMTIQVRSADKRPPTVPRWVSEMLPLSFDLALEIQKFRRLMEEKLAARQPKKEIVDWLHGYVYVDENSASAIYEYFHEQFQYAVIPHDKRLLIETYEESPLTHLIFHSLLGRRTNDALSKAYAYALSRLTHKDVELSMNDNGFVITAEGKVPIDTALRIVKSQELRLLL